MCKPLFVRDSQGMYRVRGAFRPEDIVRVAADILQDDIAGQEVMENPAKAARFVQLELAQEKNEHFAALFLNSQYRLICFERLFSGTVDGASVHPRVVVQKALEHNASALILAHNHPSGVTEPSVADRQITRRLVDALALIDVRVLDHFVVSRTSTVSLIERGLL